VFQRPPLLFNPTHESRVRAEAGPQYAQLEQRYSAALDAREAAARTVAAANVGSPAAIEAATEFRARQVEVDSVRSNALTLAGDVTHEGSRDVNYIIPHFVLSELPIGLAGLFIAAIMAAAMSAVSAELNSLSTSSVVDFYRRWIDSDAADDKLLTISRLATLFWGIVACVVATYAATLGSLIEVVNRFGSYFYGSILGVFLVAMIPFVTAWPAFFAMIAGMGAVAAVTAFAPTVSFLWYNVIGALTVVIVGSLLSGVARTTRNG
jgi:Na+/proline symporter